MLAVCVLSTEVFGSCKSDLQSDLDVNGLMNFGYVELRLIIEWSRKVPGWFFSAIYWFPFYPGKSGISLLQMDGNCGESSFSQTI